MSTITKEWLQRKITEFKSWREDIPFGLDEDDHNMLIALEIALASLEAEPVAECIVEDGGMRIDGFGEYVGHSLPDGTHQLYTAPPAPVVPEGLAKAVRFYEQVKCENPPAETGAWKDAVDWALEEASLAVNIGIKGE
ncbi:hypothetical protein RMM21_000299 [Escherichia coli]|uniref:hypothetical protein n=1 Tax=Escherichia marmotae TaxID=1499973 RepID=UPI0015D48D85|nr:hypothetical protein [Escherichia marmotae]ELE5763824.1 hypothetical protein [Escherichia coli]MDQ9237630.1 hypothetical protein [Escherichia marmotae]MDQ9314260.1 hypothetical protein [Escherichia marmotae]HAM4873036.1 hypothetical protein [Escherichia coli]